jgi:hypothetical protein
MFAVNVTATIMDRNRKSISDSELRRFIQQLTLRPGHTYWTKLQTPFKGLGITEDARDNGIEAFVMVLQVVRCPSHRIRSDVMWCGAGARRQGQICEAGQINGSLTRNPMILVVEQRSARIRCGKGG